MTFVKTGEDETAESIACEIVLNIKKVLRREPFLYLSLQLSLYHKNAYKDRLVFLFLCSMLKLDNYSGK